MQNNSGQSPGAPQYLFHDNQKLMFLILHISIDRRGMTRTSVRMTPKSPRPHGEKKLLNITKNASLIYIIMFGYFMLKIFSKYNQFQYY